MVTRPAATGIAVTVRWLVRVREDGRKRTLSESARLEDACLIRDLYRAAHPGVEVRLLKQGTRRVVEEVGEE